MPSLITSRVYMFDKPPASTVELDWEALYRHSCWDLDSFGLPFTLEEIKQVVFSFQGDKSLGPDGFSMCFFQHFWDIISADILFLFRQISESNLNLERLNYAILSLIPKKDAAKAPSDFRPISLIHSCMKIFTKVLANS